MVKLVLSDMDLTLVCPGRMQVSQRAINAIHELGSLGVRFCPASGRDVPDLTRMFRGDSACLATGIVSSGKKIYLDGELIFHIVLERVGLENLLRVVCGIPHAFILARHESGDRAAGISVNDYAHTSWAGTPGITPTPDLPEGPITTAGIMFDGERTSMDKMLSLAQEACPQFSFLSPGPGMLDVLPRGWTKAEGIKLLQARMGISRNQILAFGDSDNDLAMLEYVNNSVAVSNANERVLSAARWHIGSVYDDAVGLALSELVKAVRAGQLPAFLQE